MDYAEKMQRCHEYVEALEEERHKIQVFQRELPLCLELVTQAIEACKRELSGTTTDYMHGQSECSAQTSSDVPVPVLEEFIPIKRARPSSSDEGDDDNVAAADDDEEEEEEEEQQQQQSHKRKYKRNKSIENKDNKKSDWLRSVQLWNQPLDPPTKQDLPRRAIVTEVKRNVGGGAFQPFQKERSAGKNNQDMGKSAKPCSVPASSSTAETGTTGGNDSRKEEKEGQAQRKQRRCWSPELHRRFLQALQQLGGSHAATPKQIRELMKVDGLTNDEVKSHLQKYRLHTRRPSLNIHNNNNPQAPQFVVVGGIWVPPPPEYAAVATSTSGETATITATNEIYAPVPTVPQISTSGVQKQQDTQSEGKGSHSEVGAHSNSPSTSSSAHTTSNSPVF